ncbi:MAG: hypothetical protein ACYDG5_02125, partial [Dehalococcoidales bacterium]
YVNQYLSKFISDIPNSFTIDENSIDSHTLYTFQDIKRGIGYFQTYYYYLIAALVVLILLIFLVNWGIKAPARALGIELLIIGIIDLVGIILSKTLPLLQWASGIAKVDIPVSLNSWAQGLINDLTSVALPLAIGILVVGIILLVVSLVVPSKEREVLP